MPDPTAAEYCRFAGSRLTEARDKFQRAVVLGYVDNIGEVAKVASLVWDTAIDILSALALLDGETVTGVSADMRRYARRNFPNITFHHWRNVARLHNFQHKPNLPESEFRSELYYTGIMLDIFNTQLPQPMHLAANSLIWLTAAANQPNPGGSNL